MSATVSVQPNQSSVKIREELCVVAEIDSLIQWTLNATLSDQTAVTLATNILNIATTAASLPAIASLVGSTVQGTLILLAFHWLSKPQAAVAAGACNALTISFQLHNLCSHALPQPVQLL